VLVQFLAARGARLDAKNEQGRTPLDEALTFRRPREGAVALLRDLMVKNGIRIDLAKRVIECCAGCDCRDESKRPEQGKEEGPRR
jgi:ankyrin repeat protein